MPVRFTIRRMDRIISKTNGTKLKITNFTFSFIPV